MARKRNAVTRKADSRQRRFKFNKQVGWKKKWGMPVHRARLLAKLKGGMCLRCLINTAIPGTKRCNLCKLNRERMNKTRKR